MWSHLPGTVIQRRFETCVEMLIVSLSTQGRNVNRETPAPQFPYDRDSAGCVNLDRLKGWRWRKSVVHVRLRTVSHTHWTRPGRRCVLCHLPPQTHWTYLERRTGERVEGGHWRISCHPQSPLQSLILW